MGGSMGANGGAHYPLMGRRNGAINGFGAMGGSMGANGCAHYPAHGAAQWGDQRVGAAY